MTLGELTESKTSPGLREVQGITEATPGLVDSIELIDLGSQGIIRHLGLHESTGPADRAPKDRSDETIVRARGLGRFPGSSLLGLRGGSIGHWLGSCSCARTRTCPVTIPRSRRGRRSSGIRRSRGLASLRLVRRNTSIRTGLCGVVLATRRQPLLLRHHVGLDGPGFRGSSGRELLLHHLHEALSHRVNRVTHAYGQLGLLHAVVLGLEGLLHGLGSRLVSSLGVLHGSILRDLRGVQGLLLLLGTCVHLLLKLLYLLGSSLSSLLGSLKGLRSLLELLLVERLLAFVLGVHALLLLLHVGHELGVHLGSLRGNTLELPVSATGRRNTGRHLIERELEGRPVLLVELLGIVLLANEAPGLAAKVLSHGRATRRHRETEGRTMSSQMARESPAYTTQRSTGHPAYEITGTLTPGVCVLGEPAREVGDGSRVTKLRLVFLGLGHLLGG